ncbi:MAG: hypothetical protein COZ75_04290 [Flavobacteriaceae bacterium CG_4_8_14_3_um_filter_34_10]|nr:hypothetical protein [Flavobacteriia bacterium]OIP52061.1 MAG: hypothetical protein AUK33_02170 [Flavobacteriaceae bacterium CG2_30_34_30]PIQ17405.1 MAG: hypothetical protein COW66_12035 [Flavobacteriaceae bacterium CG18_big_fil_WC_8_21_14_2_50_34_36]PIV50398.1 MAG: hypothetical protein COS19_04290 [Flavobacteriaceae bacterium CG02_land_8_20_14_3_00_34_13]PIX09927.1 MAG: hypothetical protein COZ75_04290 [Flavobacteriaceae bacterium CG_4_8_14_3_um_filter_34_10]PIZ08993.1 MAG: hypothetical pr
MGLHKILKIVALILALIGIVFLAIILVKGDDVVKATGEGLDGYMYIAYIMFVITLAITLLFSITQIFMHKEALKKTLVSTGLFLFIFIISYVLASGEAVSKAGVEVVSESGSKWVDTGLRMFYILAIFAIGTMVYSGIRKLIKS